METACFAVDFAGTLGVEAAKKGNPCHPREGPASSPQHPYTSLEAIPGLTESGRVEDAPSSGVVRAKTSQHELLESLRACDGIEAAPRQFGVH